MLTANLEAKIVASVTDRKLAFINRSKSIHGNKYDYSDVIYKNNATKVQINCSIHGPFLQRPNDHTDQKSGCPECGKDSCIKKKTYPPSVWETRKQKRSKEISDNKENRRLLALKSFLEKSKQAHGDRYDYSFVEYVNSVTKVSILCRNHGLFYTLPGNHSKGVNCPRCGDAETSKKRTKPLSRVLEDFKSRHGNRYLYDMVYKNYVNSASKVKIICRSHGVFTQDVSSHVGGSGCSKCADLRVSRIHKRNSVRGLLPRAWSFGDWESAGKKSPEFDSFKLYVLRCRSESEDFIKIGKTFRKIENRVSRIPYKIDILSVVIGGARYISELEIRAHKMHKRYKPKKSFDGCTECFS